MKHAMYQAIDFEERLSHSALGSASAMRFHIQEGGLLELGEEFLKSRVVAQRVVIRIVLDPVSLAPAASEDALEITQRFFLLTRSCVETRRADERTQIVRIEFDRTLRPFKGSCRLAVVVERARAKRERSPILRVQREHLLGTSYALSNRHSRVIESLQHAQRLALQHQALKVLMTDGAGFYSVAGLPATSRSELRTRLFRVVV